jgi:Right handed beta helix region
VAGSSACAVTLVVGLGLPSLTPTAQVGAPPVPPPVAGALGGAAGAAGGVAGTVPVVGGSLGGGARSASSAGTVYYVAPDGRDSNRGTSPSRPWRTVARVNRAALRAGDEVLFQGGSTFSDATLMPGFGFNASGTPDAPIVFGSYGAGRAQLSRGIWLGTNAAHTGGPSHLVFQDLRLGPNQGFQGTGDYIKLVGLSIGPLLPPQGSQETGIASEGSHWVIEDNTIYDTGDSGMLLGFSAGAPGDLAGGTDYLVSHNTVTHTGLDRRLSYALHAIYLKVADATVTENRLTYFHDDGVSLRYRDAMVSHNYIAHGGIGIAWYQYDAQPGTTEMIANTIVDTDQAGIFVCGVAEACNQPIESFIVKRNLMQSTGSRGMNLQPTSGTYLVQANRDP